MSLEQHSIDQQYRTHLGNLEVAPPVHAWAAIAAQLPNEKSDDKGIWWGGAGAASAKTPGEKSKRDRVVFWWWTGALVTLATLSILGYYTLNETDTNNSRLPTPKSSATQLGPIAATQIDDLTIRPALNNESTEKGLQNAQSPVASEIAKPAAEMPFHKQLSSTTGPSNSEGSSNNSKAVASNFEATQTVIPARTAPSSTPSIPPAPLLTDTKTTTLKTSSSTVGISKESAALSALPFANLTLLHTEAPKLPFGPDVGCPTFNNQTDWSFAVRLFGGPGTIFQEYTSTVQTAAYAMMRDSIETHQLSVHGGLRFEAVNDLGLFVRAGVDYQMYRMNNQFLGPRSSRTVIDSIFMEDTQTWRVERSNVSVQEQRTVYNRQHAVVFTGGIGFRKTFGNISPYIMAEAGYEILFKRKGLLVLPNETVADLSEDDQGLYINKRPGLQYGGVIGVDFALTDRIEVGLSGHYKKLGGIRGSADLLDYDQSTAFGALNLRYTIR